MTQTTRKPVSQLTKMAIVAIALLAFFNASLAQGKNRKNIQMKTTIAISPTGDANVDVDIAMPMQAYTMVKRQFGSAQYLARQLNKAVAWSEIKDLKGKFVDSNNSVNATLTHIGYAKPYKHGKWVIDLSKEELTLVAIADNTAHFSAAMDMPFGATNVICRLKLPKGSTNHKYNAEKGRLFYDYVPEFEAGDDGEMEYELDTKDKVMSSLAKIYGNEKFDNFWVARSKFHNSGDQVVTNLRVRHRIANMSSWSGWKKTKIVYPGQTVIEPFFPVFDIEKIASFTSTRNAMVEVEYRYEIDGEKFSDTDSGKLQILARNEVQWSSCETAEAMNFFDLFDNCPAIYAAFANSNDPVVQQVAAAVSRMINGRPPQTDKEAVLYLRALWKFMEMNRIAYQLPPGNIVEGKMVQHLKYARDVIRNKAGTCADLAVFWASVGKAAGMESVICGVPGHAFPVFILPQSKRPFAIESTAILSRSFDEACKIGMGTLAKNIQRGTIYQVNINQMQSNGIHCLDLPKVETDFLKKLGYKLELESTSQKTTPRRNQQQNENQRTNRQNSLPKSLIGVWRCEIQGNGGSVVVAAAFAGDGSAATATKAYDANGNEIDSDSDKGVWSANQNTIFTKSSVSGKNYQYKYRFQNGYLILTIDGNELAFKKVK